MTAARPLVVAHRGAWGDAPQNSLAALETAIALGCDMVELDVRVTRDRRLVVVHDARAGVGGAPITGLDLAELRARLPSEQAPELEAMVELAAGRIGLDVELKVDDRVDGVLAVLGRRLQPDQYVVTSFLDSALLGVRVLAPETRTGLLVGPGGRPLRLAARLDALGASFLAPHSSLARAGLLAWAANRSHECYVWTVNDRRGLASMLSDERVAAVITDRPGAALRVRHWVVPESG